MSSSEYEYIRSLRKCPYKPFAELESYYDVRGSSEIGLSVYNQVQFNRYMAKLTESGVDMLEHSSRVQRGLKLQAKLRRKFKIRKKTGKPKSEARYQGSVQRHLMVVR